LFPPTCARHDPTQGGSIFAGATAKLNMTRVSFTGGVGVGGAIALRGLAEAVITDVHAENNFAPLVRLLGVFVRARSLVVVNRR
jgi:hypothetical protein